MRGCIVKEPLYMLGIDIDIDIDIYREIYEERVVRKVTTASTCIHLGAYT